MKGRLKAALAVLGLGSAVIMFTDRIKSSETRHRQGFYEKYIKRVQDFWCGIAALIVLSPVMMITSVLIRWKIGSQVIFKQKRVGRDECIFELYKFRTMTNERGSDGKLLPDEMRLTPFGKSLRATSLDELPEIINIIKGDMSVVGPRPLLVEYLPRYSEEQRHRHDVRPGLTGLAQVSGRNSISWEEKFQNDCAYVKNISFANDWKIIFKTVLLVVKHDGISSPTSATMEVFEG